MNSPRSFLRVLKGATLIGIPLFAIWLTTPATAQTPSANTRPVVAIDGAVTPERIPDWILWREVFGLVTRLADKSPDSGRSYWANSLGLSPAQVAQLVAQGRAWRDEEGQMNLQARNLIGASGAPLSPTARVKLHQIQAAKESRILARRDSLRGSIGTDAFERIRSFARLHIAPTIKVGGAAVNR